MTPPDLAVGQAYLYGLLPAEARVPEGLTGVGGAPVSTARAGHLQLVVSVLEPDRFGTADDLLAHSRVLDRLVEDGDVVPVAVGTFVPSPPDDPAVGRLTAAYDRVRSRVAGAVQYTLTVRYLEEVALTELVREDRAIARLRELTSRSPGRRADQLRLGEMVVAGLDRKAALDADRVLHGMQPVRELRRRKRGRPEEVAEVAALVDRDARGEFEARMERLAAEHAERMRFRLVGPQAPFDFVGEG